MKVLIALLVLVPLLGCRFHAPADPADVQALARYQHLAPGTPVVVVLKIGVTMNGQDMKSFPHTIEIEGKIGSISQDTLSLALRREGKWTTMDYAGRMIGAIRELKPEAKR